nr:MAG TPA: hypothetical protein [Caudoviricetes sp.]
MALSHQDRTCQTVNEEAIEVSVASFYFHNKEYVKCHE